MTNTDRWENFSLRDGDIFICTPSKSGTTWMQAICAHIVFKDTEFYAPIGEISPWYDVDGTAVEDIVAKLEAQTHRRIIKSHTPLDGMPYFENATYVHVARNPLDVMFSMINHMGNMKKDLPGATDLEDRDALFDRWLATTVEGWGEAGGLSLGYLLHHTKTFWAYKSLPNVHLFHYATMRADLPGQMKRLADLLGEDVPDDIWPRLIEGVSLKNMKANAEVFAPGVGDDVWKSKARFFHKGRQGEGAQLLSAEQIGRYEKKASELATPDLKAWIERGAI